MMRSEPLYCLGVTLLLCFALTQGGEVDEIAAEVQVLRSPLTKLAKSIFGISSSSKPNNTYTTMKELNKAMFNAGPTLMLTGSTISTMTAFLAESQSVTEDLKFLKENFDVVANALSRVENKIGLLESVVVHESTKNSYAGYQRNIENLYIDWQHAATSRLRNQEEINRAFFLKQYDLHYKHAALNLHKAMVGHFDGQLNNDLLMSAKTRFKCNGVKIRHLCASVTQTINQGLAVEGAYYAYMTMKERQTTENDLWTKRMKILSDKCEAVVKECSTNWKDHVLPIMSDTYNQYKNASNQVLAQKVFNTLNENFGQRAWLVFVYNVANGYKQHGYQSQFDELFGDVQKRWRENNKMFTVISLDMDTYPFFSDREDAQNQIIAVRDGVMACKGDLPTEKEKEAAIVLLDLLEGPNHDKGLITYAIHSSLNLALAATSDRFVQATIQVPKDCKANQRFDFHLFIIG